MPVIDARELNDGTELVSRVVVVGTGPAGMSLALEVARAGHDVLLLEGGALKQDRHAQDSLHADSESQSVESIDKVREKRLGGTSHQWGGRTYPFDQLDFDDRPQLGFGGWPITRDELMPYYRRAADRLDLRRFEWTAAEAIEGAPRHFLGESSEIVNDEAIWRWSPPVQFGKVYAAEGVKLPNLTLVHHAQVVGLHQDPETGRITHLDVAPQPGRAVRVTGEHVVLATGGMEIARLLLVSGIGNEHDQVGRNFMIHPIASVGRVTLADPASAPTIATFTKSHDGVWVRRLLQLQDAVRRDEGLLNLGCAIWYLDPRDPAHGDPLLSAFALTRKALMATGGFKSTGMHAQYAQSGDTKAHLRNIMRGLPKLVKFSGEWAKDRWIDPRTRASFTQVSPTGEYAIRFDAEQSPDPENRVTLSDERDEFGVPRLKVQHRVSAEDRANYHRSLVRLAEGINATGWAHYDPPAEEELQAMRLVDATHQMGLVRMGHDPQHGVVDSNLRVWSTPNLHLASSGVFPTGGMAGPTLTIVAVSLRLADHLIRTLSESHPRVTSS
jgi:choline dehydrogenase-like flavoprotein